MADTLSPMSKLQATIHRPGQPAQCVSLDADAYTVGRSAQCDISINDASLSRQHARLTRQGEGWRIEDLGSHNGTRLNGRLLSAPEVVKAGDELDFGHARITLGLAGANVGASESPPAFLDDIDSASLRMQSSVLRSSLGLSMAPSSGAALPILETLQAMCDLTLELLNDLPPEALFAKVLDKLFALLRPERGIILLRDKTGALHPVLTRLPAGINGPSGDLPISRTVVEAVVKRGEALLIDGRISNDALAQAQSFAGGKQRMALAAPLENGGIVEGMIYLEVSCHKRIYGENDLRLVAALANVVTAKLQAARMAAAAQASRAMERDFALARDIQRRLLPDAAPVIPGFSLHGVNVPSRQVSGDLYDFHIRPDGRVYIVIADVCGKGIGPALLMACMQTYLAAWAEYMLPPAQLASKLSTEISKRTTPGKFITAFLVLLDPATGVLEYCNAGHNPALLLRADGTPEWLGGHGPPLALLPDRSYGEGVLTLAPGDQLLLYTDGITEAENAAEEEFGVAKLLEEFTAHRKSPLPEIEARLSTALNHFTGNVPPHDDRTLVMIRREH